MSLSWWQTRNLVPDGSPVPPTRLAVLGGGETVLGADAGRTQLVYFFAPWCAVCSATAANTRFLAQYTSLEVVAVALAFRHPAAVEDFVTRHRLGAVPVLMGDDAVAAAWRVSAFPTFYIVRGGTIVAHSVGYTTTLGLWLRALLG